MDEENKDEKIEIVSGNHKDLDISDVRDNLNFEISQKNDPTNEGEIVIPENIDHNNAETIQEENEESSEEENKE